MEPKYRKRKEEEVNEKKVVFKKYPYMGYTYNGPSFRPKTERHSDTCYNMMNLDDIMLNEISHSKRKLLCDSHLYEMPRFTESESRTVVTQSWGKSGMELVFNEYRFTVLDDEKFSD